MPTPTPLATQFASLTSTPRGALLSTLMLLCGGVGQKIAIICVGAGDAYITRYWPIFRRVMNQDRILLTVADQYSLEDLVREKVTLAQQQHPADATKLAEAYESFARAVSEHRVQYLNSHPSSPDSWRYAFMRAHIVFILVPDDVHVEEAEKWIGRADLILIEKPYDRDLARAEKFVRQLIERLRVQGNSGVPQTISAMLDHYFAKCFELVRLCAREPAFLERKIGRLLRVEFSVCEAGPVEAWRQLSLQAGLIYDLYCHVLAMVSPFVQLDTLEFLEVRVARHQGCPISAESFAFVHARVRDRANGWIELSGFLGKGLTDCKFLRFVGDKGALAIDLSSGVTGLMTHVREDGSEEPFAVVGKGHLEIFDSLFDPGHKRFTDDPVGGLTNEQALDILRHLSFLRTKVERVQTELAKSVHEYPLGRSSEEVLNRWSVKLSL